MFILSICVALFALNTFGLVKQINAGTVSLALWLMHSSSRDRAARNRAVLPKIDPFVVLKQFFSVAYKGV
jgi:hypothetical protein